MRGSITLLCLALGCHVASRRAQPPRPTPRPTEFSAAQAETALLDSIRAYVNRLQFDTTPGAFDERPVDFARDTIGTGPTARIEPEIGSAVVDDSALAQEGRIVARIRSVSTHAPAGFGPWWTYWWVDKSGGKWRSLFIRADSSGKPRVRSGYLPHEPPRYATPCPATPGAACARFNKGNAGYDVSGCYKCGGYWCSAAVPM